jgi:hypothetical protein
VIKLRQKIAKAYPSELPKLYALVAATIRRRILSESDAKVVAEWFDRLAAGDSGNTVFPQTRKGRPRGSRTARKRLLSAQANRLSITGTDLEVDEPVSTTLDDVVSITGTDLEVDEPVATTLDDVDIAWIVRRAINQHGLKPGAAYKAVAAANRMKHGTVRNIYSRLRNDLAPDPDDT